MLSELNGLLFSHTDSLPDVEAYRETLSNQRKIDQWDQVVQGDDYKPSLVVLKTGGDVHIISGDHKNGHIRIAVE